MSNAWFRKGAQAVGLAEIDFEGDTIKVALIDAAYVESLSSDEFYADISASVLSTPQILANATFTDGVLDGDDVTFPAVTAGDVAQAVVIYKDTGNEATSRLIAWIDELTGFPAATTGGDMTIRWSGGADKILAF
jgi:hypothetical protein